MRFSLPPFSSAPAQPVRRFAFAPMSPGGGGRKGNPPGRPFCHRPTTSSHDDRHQYQGPGLYPPPGPHPPPQTWISPRPPPAFHDAGSHPPPPRQRQQHGYRIPHVPPSRGTSRPVHAYVRPRPDDYRRWVSSKSQPPPHCERFRLLSYNILADYLARDHRSKLYFHIPPRILDWEWRKRKILLEIGLWSPDIMCLQEVDRYPELEEEMATRGYCGIWKMRTGTAIDGCATFWRTNRFQLRYEEFIEFNKIGLRDNIAQICVLESSGQGLAKPGSGTSGSSVRSQEPNQVVVCNIHVLYNPKRGEIKLGQIRVLLDRACSISKVWNNAPILICGDMNSVPKSPFYNFLSEQKLELSGLARDQVSGQYTASIRFRQPYSNYDRNRVGAAHCSNDHGFPVIPGEKVDPQGPNHNLSVDKFRSQHAKESTEPSGMLGRKIYQERFNVQECSELSDERKEGRINSYDFMSALQVSNEKASSLTKPVLADPEVPSDLQIDVTQNSSVEMLSEILPSENRVLSPNSTDRPSKYHLDISPSVQSTIDEKSDVSLSESVTSNIDEKSFVGALDDSGSYAGMQSKVPDNLQSNSKSCDTSNESYSEETGGSICGNHSVELEANLPKAIASNAKTFYPNVPSNRVDCGRNTLRYPVGEKPDPKFVAELHDLDDTTGSTKGNEILDSTISNKTLVEYNTEVQNMSINDPTTWTPANIESASGNSECTLLQHNLKLKSVYTEVEDCSGTRDSSGEPEITSYNREFMGTVDYIWRSEGVQTVKILDTIRKDVLQRTAGFPTPKWGSDHIAIACELAFVKE